MQYEYQVDKGQTYGIYPPLCCSLTMHAPGNSRITLTGKNPCPCPTAHTDTPEYKSHIPVTAPDITQRALLITILRPMPEISNFAANDQSDRTLYKTVVKV